MQDPAVMLIQLVRRTNGIVAMGNDGLGCAVFVSGVASEGS